MSNADHGGLPGDTSSSIGDKAIVANVLVSFGVGAVLFLVYCGIRKVFRGVYSPNVTSTERPKWPQARDGHFSWLVTTWRTTDSELLAMVGLEAYVFLQAMKLMAGILLSIAVPVLLILLPAYAGTGTGDDLALALDLDDEDDSRGSNVFYRLSILNASRNFLWLPFLVSYLVALLVLYVVYLFYRNYALLRQAYLRKPSALTGAVKLKRMIHWTGSIDAARRLIDVQTRAVLLTGVSHKYDRDRLMILLNGLGMGDIDALTLVSDRTELAKCVRRRNKAVVQFERACQHLFKQLVKHGAVEGLTKLPELEEYLAKNVPLQESQDDLSDLSLLLAKLTDRDFCRQHRPILKRKGVPDADAIRTHFDELIEYEREFEELLANNGGDRSPLLHGPDRGESLRDLKRSFTDRTTLVSFAKFTWLSHNLKDFKLTMWGTSQTAIVLFEEPRAAAAVAQSVLSRQLFSMRSEKCPQADDLLWDNLYVPSADRRLRHIAGNLMYVLFILLFANITAALTIVTDLDKLSGWLPFLRDLPPKLHSLLQGVMAPLAYNIALALAPTVLRMIASFQGWTSKSDATRSVLGKLSWFYFIQSFVVVMLARSVVDLVSFVTKRNWGPLLQAFRESLVNKSSFFFNFIVQKALLSTMVLLMRFDALFFALIKKASALSWTPRQYADEAKPEPFFYADNYANYGTFLLQITLAFAMITPITVVPGLLYFLVAYMVFRHQLLYSYITNHESGGLYWRQAVHQILFGVLISQFFTTAHFALRGNVWIAVGMLPLLVLTGMCMRFFKGAFESKSTHLPLSFEDDQLVGEVIKELERHQSLLISGDEDTDGGDSRATHKLGDMSSAPLVQIPIRPLAAEDLESSGAAEAGSSADDSLRFDQATVRNPYKNPVLFRRLPTIILSPMLLAAVKYLSNPTGSAREEEAAD